MINKVQTFTIGLLLVFLLILTNEVSLLKADRSLKEDQINLLFEVSHTNQLLIKDLEKKVDDERTNPTDLRPVTTRLDRLERLVRLALKGRF